MPAVCHGSTGTYSTAFYANVGDSNGPAKIVMAEGTPTKSSITSTPQSSP